MNKKPACIVGGGENQCAAECEAFGGAGVVRTKLSRETHGAMALRASER
jgi:hypothetical protein